MYTYYFSNQNFSLNNYSKLKFYFEFLAVSKCVLDITKDTAVITIIESSISTLSPNKTVRRGFDVF